MGRISHAEEVFAVRRVRLSPPMGCHGRLQALHLRDCGKGPTRAVVDRLVLHLRAQHMAALVNASTGLAPEGLGHQLHGVREADLEPSRA